ncbi:MAG: 2-oxoacid:acceptor oxidoreductase subunit alpha [Sandaracinaceae bacterium]
MSDAAIHDHEQDRTVRDSVVIRFSGDSGDGMQVTGAQFTETTALAGNDLSTFPDFPAEIRAPAGTTYGVSGFQIQLADHEILTPGDAPDVLVAMNAAALRVNLPSLKEGGLVLVNTSGFNAQNLKKAGYGDANPLEDGTLDPYRTLRLDIGKLTLDAVKPFGLSTKHALRCKNFWTLGLLYWMFDRDRQPTVEWLRRKFRSKPEIAEANIAALRAGHAYGETAELPHGFAFKVPEAHLPPGEYRNITGIEATTYGLVAGARLADLPLFYGSYPITPASNLLHGLAALKNFGVTTFQAEDEIAAVCAAIGASFGGALGVTGTSGPGLALKGEALGLAISVELPLVVVDVQRAGPSTGMPTKTEQSDLLQAIWGRNGDAPLCVLAAASPGDCFRMAVEAVRIATQYMTPVILLTDGFIANSTEPWQVPDIGRIEPFKARFREEPEGFHPFLREGPKPLSRVWAVPGTPGLEHRIGGLEKGFDDGNVSYDPSNHQRMTDVRRDKILSIADDLPSATIELGDDAGDMVVVGWGSTYGAIYQAVRRVRREGRRVSQLHLRHLWPLPHGLRDALGSFRQVLVPEMNDGMLSRLLRSELLVDAESLSQVTGQPFKVSDLAAAIRERTPRPTTPVAKNPVEKKGAAA